MDNRVLVVYNVSDEELNIFKKGHSNVLNFKLSIPNRQPVDIVNIIVVPKYGYIKLEMDTDRLYMGDLSSLPAKKDFLKLTTTFQGEPMSGANDELEQLLLQGEERFYRFNEHVIRAEFVPSNKITESEILKNPLAIRAKDFKKSGVFIKRSSLMSISAIDFFSLVNSVGVKVPYYVPNGSDRIIYIEKVEESDDKNSVVKPICLDIEFRDTIGTKIDKYINMCAAGPMAPVYITFKNNTYSIVGVKYDKDVDKMLENCVEVNEKLIKSGTAVRDAVLSKYGFTRLQQDLLVAESLDREIVFSTMDAINSFDLRDKGVTSDCLKTRHKVADTVFRSTNTIILKNAALHVTDAVYVKDSDMEYCIDEEELYSLLDELYMNVDDHYKYLIEEFKFDSRTWIVEPNHKSEGYKVLTLDPLEDADVDNYIERSDANKVIRHTDIHRPILAIDSSYLEDSDYLAALTDFIYTTDLTVSARFDGQTREVMLISGTTLTNLAPNMKLCSAGNITEVIQSIGTVTQLSNGSDTIPTAVMDPKSGRVIALLGLIPGFVDTDEEDIIWLAEDYLYNGDINLLNREIKRVSGFYPELKRESAKVKSF